MNQSQTFNESTKTIGKLICLFVMHALTVWNVWKKKIHKEYEQSASHFVFFLGNWIGSSSGQPNVDKTTTIMLIDRLKTACISHEFQVKLIVEVEWKRVDDDFRWFWWCEAYGWGVGTYDAQCEQQQYKKTAK